MSVKHSIRIFFIFIIALVYTGSLTAQEKAYPKNGEGITLFLKRFNRTGGTYQKEFIELNKGKLGKNNTLRMGVKYTLPPLASAPQKKNYQPLFGKPWPTGFAKVLSRIIIIIGSSIPNDLLY